MNRPIIETAGTEQSAQEQFQNKTLRPILKMLHDAFIRLMRQYFAKHKVSLAQKNKIEAQKIIEHTIQTNKQLRAFLLGMVCAHFNQDEWNQYFMMESEVNRRIYQMITQRVISTLDQE